MKAYYHARAQEYDDWWLGRGLFAERERPGWHEAVEELEEALRGLPPARTLDVACGTGFLTRHLSGEIVGMDQSPAMAELARERVPHARFVVGDAFALPFADASFDRVFTSFFYCHLEECDRHRFVGEARRLARELVVVGSVGHADGWQERTLNDGSTWQVYKRMFEPDALAQELAGEVVLANRWFVVVRS
ncbi:MAG TPA: class I SAM-dependent methyltransferase [Gaiellaceae bacterium]